MRRSASARSEPNVIELIRDAAELVAVGQRAAREQVTPGVTELELWKAASAAMATTAGVPVEASVDLMVGPGTTEVGRPPGARAVEAGEAVLFDLAPRRNGYWADSCATFSCGTPAGRLRRRHDAVRRALEQGMYAIRPGARACDVDAVMRVALADAGLFCPHHTGHGVGAAAQEAPWLLPEDQTVLDEGMVLAVEPGAYSDGIGVRLEHMVLVRPLGADVLTTHSIELT